MSGKYYYYVNYTSRMKHGLGQTFESLNFLDDFLQNIQLHVGKAIIIYTCFARPKCYLFFEVSNTSKNKVIDCLLISNGWYPNEIVKWT